jgi:hypothetical protein
MYLKVENDNAEVIQPLEINTGFFRGLCSYAILCNRNEKNGRMELVGSFSRMQFIKTMMLNEGKYVLLRYTITNVMSGFLKREPNEYEWVADDFEFKGDKMINYLRLPFVPDECQKFISGITKIMGWKTE